MPTRSWFRPARLAWFAGALALVLVAGTVTAGFVLASRDLADPGDVTAAPSLPRRLGAPGLFTPDLRHRPIGAASVVFTSDDWGWDGQPTDLALTGLRGDRYRSVSSSFDSTAGLTAILSPDGTRLAVQDAILDLASGAVTRLPPATGDYRIPAAWSPDGRLLATVTYTQPEFTAPMTFIGPWTSPVTHAALSVVDTSTGRETRIADLDMTANFDGWLAAFSPDGARLAYQSGNRIRVATVTGAPIGGFDVPTGTRIGGKGAWTPDGRGLAVVAEQSCGCGREYDARWTLTTLDASTGAATGPTRSLDGVVAVRVLGWSRDGYPVIQTFDAGPVADLDPTYTVVDFRPHSRDGIDQTGVYLSGVEDLANVFGVRVLVLTGASAPQVLLASRWSGAESVDVADSVIASGRTRPGQPPAITVDLLMGGIGNGLLAYLALSLVAAIGLAGRRLTRWRPWRTATAVAPPVNG